MPTTTPLGFRRQVPGSARAEVGRMGERDAVVVRIDPERGLGALATSDGDTLCEAAALALRQRLPLVLHVSSSGVDIAGGIEALAAWGGRPGP